MTVKIKFDRKTGKVKKITGNIGQTRANLAAFQLWRGNIEPTRWYKLRRFFKRLSTEISARAILATEYHSERFDEVPYIGLEEHV
jgi:hypothetical protein